MKHMNIVMITVCMGTSCVASEPADLRRTASVPHHGRHASTGGDLLERSVSVGNAVSSAGLTAPASSEESLASSAPSYNEEHSGSLSDRHASVTARPGAALPPLVRDGGRTDIRRGALVPRGDADQAATTTVASLQAARTSVSETLRGDSDEETELEPTQPLESGQGDSSDSEE